MAPRSLAHGADLDLFVGHWRDPNELYFNGLDRGNGLSYTAYDGEAPGGKAPTRHGTWADIDGDGVHTRIKLRPWLTRPWLVVAAARGLLDVAVVWLL